MTYPWMTKIVLNLKKGICEKPPANIIENDKRLNAFILDQEQARMSTLTAFIQRCLELAARAVKQETEIQGIQIKKCS